MLLAERLTDAPLLPLGGRSWRLVITYGVLLDCQEATGLDMLNGVEAFLQTSAKVLRPRLWSILRRSEPGISLEAVGAMITPRNLDSIRRGLIAAFVASMPEPPKQPQKESRKPPKTMGWMQTAAVARMELRLADAELLDITPRYFHALREVSVERMRREEFLIGEVCEVVVNGSACRPKKPAKASDWVRHKLPEEIEEEPLDIGEKMLRALEKIERQNG